MDKQSLRGCPICNNYSCETLHNQKFALMHGVPLPNEYDIVSCKRCGFVYADTSANQTKYDIYYEKFSKYEDELISSGSGFDEYDNRRLIETASLIARYIPDKSKSIVDIGCGNGGLLEKLSEIGFRDLTGVDPSQKCVDNVKNRGTYAVQGSIFNLNRNKKYDCIILSEVLEHVEDLNGAVSSLKSILKENGLIYMDVPDASRYAEYFIAPFYYFDCEHINHFDIYSIQNLFLEFKLIENGEKELSLDNNNKYPIFYSIFKYEHSNRKIIEDIYIKEKVLKFINQSYKPYKKIDDKIKGMYESGEDVYIFGAGQYLLRILNNTYLSKCNVKGLIDNDKNKQGKVIDNLKIYSPEHILNYNGCIVVVSALYSKNIVEQIRHMGLTKNEIIVINE